MCAHCPKQEADFSSRKIFLKHTKTHQNEEFPCGSCGKICKSKNALTDHNSKVHIEKALKCDHCEKTFKDNRNLLNRIEKRLENIKDKSLRYWTMLKEYENMTRIDTSILAPQKRGKYQPRKKKKVVTKKRFSWKK